MLLNLIKKTTLINCLIISVVALFFFRSIQEDVGTFNEGLNAEQSKVVLLFENQINSYVYGLQGARGILNSYQNKYIPQEFYEYSLSRNFFDNFPGSLGFGFIRYVKKAQFEKYVFSVDFKVTANKDLAEHMIVELIQPAEPNKTAIGFDISIEAHRKEAAWLAARTGKPTLTKAIHLFQKNSNHVGFLFLLPTYTKTIPLASEKERLNSLVGWVYAPIVLEDVLKRVEKYLPRGVNTAILAQGAETEVTVGSKIIKDKFIRNEISSLVSIAGIDWQIRSRIETNLIWAKIKVIFLSYFLLLSFLLVSYYLIQKLLTGQNKLIEEKDQWINSIMNNASHSIISTDTDGIIRTFSPAAEAMLGYTADELVGKITPEIIHDPNEVMQEAKELSRELKKNIRPSIEVFQAKPKLGIPYTKEWTYIRKNGDRFPVRLCVTSVLDAQKNITGFIGIAEDLTDYNTTKQNLESERLKLINATKLSLLGEMAGGIANEINTPLAIIQGKASLLIDKMQRSSGPADYVTELQKIINTVQRISKIVKSMKIYSRTNEKDPLILTSVEETIQTALDLFTEKMRYQNIDLQVDIQKNIFFVVRANEIIQVLINLLNNSFDAVRGHTHSWIKIKVFAFMNQIEIQVTDSGFGIPDELQEKILIPFFTTKPVGAGTGLGLSISKSLIEANHGVLFLNTKSEHTQFIIRLPQTQPQPEVSL